MIDNFLAVLIVSSSILLLMLINRKATNNYFKIFFSGYIISSSLWSLSVKLILLWPAYANILGRTKMVMGSWAPYFLILSILIIFEKEITPKKIFIFAIPPLILSLLIIFSNTIINSYHVLPKQETLIINKGDYTALYFVYHLLAIAYQFYLATSTYIYTTNLKQKLLVAVVFYSVVGSYCLAVILGVVLPLFFKQDSIVRYAPIASIILGFGLSYSIWRYQVFKIRLVFRESAIFATSFAFFSTIIAGFFFVLGINTAHNPTLIPWSMLGGVLLSQLLNAQIKTLLYRAFNKDKLAFEKALHYLYQSFGEVMDRTKLKNNISGLIEDIFKPLKYEFKILPLPNKTSKYNTPSIYYEDDPLFPVNERNKGHDIAMILVFNQQLLGFIFMTLNKHYLNYTFENMELLEIFARQVSIALANTLSYEELQQQQQRMFQTEKIALLGQLTAGIVHELRNPLTAITMTVSNMKQCLDETNYDKKIIERLWRSGQNSIQEMKQFLENMRTFSREDHCLMEPIELRNIVEEIVPLLRKKASEHHVQFIQQVPTNLKLTCNAQRIKQVLLNLLLNGIEAMPTGGKLSLTGQAKEQQVIIKVADTGSGIPEVLRNKIFTPFYTTKKEGTGLGLSIVKEIVEAHRGSISIASNAGQGTTFTLNLPQS